ncbi:hypothetical protein GPECTOR_105g110 [Gonium pectorale]|uniref:non-specific serine/threonine protein kinase n=1 Tax=Gonium pectorale TaxID=33097 RepID=A0A150FZL2_GONPE|nr:hypothetical protein GPECTOR_105g110 [Gonium pectorale]|eukprot:KXZ43056.1 hypothetical protein GPECTOR_105g110 [Gonium pectorale]
MSVPASLATLIPLLKANPSAQTPAQASQEAALLEDVALQYSSTYDFVSSTAGPTGRAFRELFDALVRFRLLQSSWRTALRPPHLLRVLQVGGIGEGLGDEWGLAALAAEEAHLTLLQLLNCTDPGLLPLVLVGLIGFAGHRSHFAAVTAPAGLETLLRIVTQYDLPFKRLAADLLALLARREAVVSELLALSGLGRLVGQLAPGVDGPLAQSLLRVLCYVAADAGAVAEMYHVGSIPVLVSLVGSAVRELASCPPATGPVLPPGRPTELQLVATCLTRLAEHDECAAQVRACNGVTLLGKLLLAQPARGEDGRPSEKSSREVLSLKAYVFRALRYLFSVERNRKMFKRLFPPDLFAAFIDAGHYNAQLNAYAPLVTHFEELSDKQKAGVAAALDDVSVEREGSGLRVVGGYVILEMLGKGAFGAVYKARKTRGESLVALKELPLSDIGLFGATESEVSAGVGRMSKEVEILSSLSHPNIVQYYESFAVGPNLYIAMELVEGTSLLDHLQVPGEGGGVGGK